MSVAKKERRRILKRVKRGIKARAESGKVAGGASGLGYIVVGMNSSSDLKIDAEGAKLVRLIFNTLDEEGGNLWKTAKIINAMGYTGERKALFSANSIAKIATRKLYIGILESRITTKVSHRPDLQIIEIDQFKRVNEMITNRKKGENPKIRGRRGRYVLTGFIGCSGCGGPVVAANQGGKKGVIYQCITHRNHKSIRCSSPKTYTERLILPPIIDFLANLLVSQIDTITAMQKAAAQYGKSATEEALETAIQGEIESVEAGKQRLIEAVSNGTLTTEEVVSKMTRLRERERELRMEMAAIAEKSAIIEQWQIALNSLEGKNQDKISERLYSMAENTPIAFRRIMSLVFEPNSLRVRTEHIKGSRKWVGYLDDYQLTAAIKEIQDGMPGLDLSFGNKSLRML